MFPPSSLPWYKSQVIMAALVSVISKMLVLFGLTAEWAPEDMSQITDILVLLVGGVADLWAMRARITQKASPPITMTNKE